MKYKYIRFCLFEDSKKKTTKYDIASKKWEFKNNDQLFFVKKEINNTVCQSQNRHIFCSFQCF